MTREEAIANLNMISVAFVDPVTGEQRKLIDDTFEMAIKALEQEPCEDEYIKVPKKALKYRTAGMVAYNAEWLKNHFDIERVAICGEQEPCEDAISRQATLASIKNLYPDIPVMDIFGSRRKWLEKYAPYFECENAIEQLPPVTPQPKIGHWITKEAYSEDKAMGFTEQIVCSNCDMQNSYFSEWDKCKNPISKTFIRSKFCPNCGCRMFEPQESEKRSDKE